MQMSHINMWRYHRNALELYQEAIQKEKHMQLLLQIQFKFSTEYMYFPVVKLQLYNKKIRIKIHSACLIMLLSNREM
jgi:hypothetical protein